MSVVPQRNRSMSWFVLVAVATLGIASILITIIWFMTDPLFALDLWEPEPDNVDSRFGAEIYRVTSLYSWIIGSLPLLMLLAVGVSYIIRSR